jgi:hypothetical protein
MMIKELSPFSRLKLAVSQLAQPEAFFRFLSFGMLAPTQERPDRQPPIVPSGFR